MKHLGISIDNTLSWRDHVDSIVGKATSIMGFLACNFKHCSVDVNHRCYLTLIRPVLEYAASVWSPYLLTLMNRIESVQCRSVRFIFNDYRRASSVTCILKKLNLPLLSDRRICNRIITMFIILNGIIHVPTESIVAFNTSQTRGHNYKLHQLPASTNIYA